MNKHKEDKNGELANCKHCQSKLLMNPCTGNYVCECGKTVMSSVVICNLPFDPLNVDMEFRPEIMF